MGSHGSLLPLWQSWLSGEITLCGETSELKSILAELNAEKKLWRLTKRRDWGRTTIKLCKYRMECEPESGHRQQTLLVDTYPSSDLSSLVDNIECGWRGQIVSLRSGQSQRRTRQTDAPPLVICQGLSSKQKTSGIGENLNTVFWRNCVWDLPTDGRRAQHLSTSDQSLRLGYVTRDGQ